MRPGFSVLRRRVSNSPRHQSWKMSTLLKIIRKERGQSLRNTCFRHPAENGENSSRVDSNAGSVKHSELLHRPAPLP